MNKVTTYKSIRRIFKSGHVFNKELTDFRILSFNENFKKAMKKYSNNYEDRVVNIEEIFRLIDMYQGVSEVEKKQNGEVFTPFKLINEMLDTLPVEVWTNPNLKWLDPANGIGNFPAVIVQRLMVGLKDWEPDGFKRYKHIMENMVYICDISYKNMWIYTNIFDPNNEIKLNYFRGSFLTTEFDNHMKDVWGIENFDIVVGNPPYQENDGGGNNGMSAKPIYNLFTEKSYEISTNILFITPSRWFIKGKGLDKFKHFMLSNENLELIKHFPGSGKDVFGNGVEIKGGVSYFLINKKYNGLLNFNGNIINKSQLDILLTEPKHYDIITKIKNKHNGVYMNNIVESSNFFGKTIDNRKTLRNSKDCVNEKIDDNYLKCYVSQREGFEKWVNKDLIKSNRLGNYKVLTSKATNVGSMGNIFISKPNEVCSETYLVIVCDTENEAKNLISYFKLKFVKYLFKLINNTQNSSKDTYKLIPQVPLDREWTDQQLYEYFELTQEEINLIEETVK